MRLTVVIPARDAARTIERAVAAARAQELGDEFEVIVVDDGSRDDTAALAAAAGARVVAHDGPRGPAAARNTGASVAQCDALAFTDADCEAAPGWLAAGARALERADIVQGRVEPDPDVRLGPFDHVISVERETGLFEAANLFVRRDWFERAGGFQAFIDPASGHFGEDTVFGWRVRRAGGRMEFAGDAVVRHEVVPRTAGDWIAERARLKLFPRLTREVPELRERYFLRVFLTRRTAALDLGVAGVLGALLLRRPLLALLVIPYARMVRGHDPAMVAGDVVGLTALVRGSAAARTPVL